MKSENTTALYKANITVFGDFFSGLVLFKYNADKEDFNIVLLSEVGLTLCEFYSANDTIIVQKASSLFANKMAQQTLANDFGYLVHNSGPLKELKTTEFKNGDKVKYTLDSVSQVQQIRKRRIINGVIVDLNDYQNGLPSNINFKHKGISFNIKLTLLKLN